MGFRLSNVIGAPFRNYVSEQLYLRATKGSTEVRSGDEILYLANKNAWVRLISSVDVNETYLRYLKSAYSEAEGFTFESGDSLAKNWFLQAGTSQLIDGKTQLRSGLGLNGAYGLGGIQDQGYRPMPGLESVTIETAGRLGSLRYATINFKVWSMNQLDIIDALYFRLGFTMLLEWGHVSYYTNEGVYTTSLGGITNFFPQSTGDVIAKESVQYAINSKIRETDGNYDGMLGTVTNFNYSFNQDGGWDCSIKLIGLGNIIDTQKINSQYKLPEGAAKEFQKAQNELIALLKRQRQSELRQQAQDQIDAEKRNYAAAVSAIEANSPIADRVSAYKRQYQLQGTIADPATGVDPENGTLRQLLNMVAVSAGRTNEPIPYADRRSNREFLNVKGNINDVLYIVNGLAYPAWITKGPPNALTPAGFRYPIQVGSVYKLNVDRLEGFAKQALDGARAQGFSSWVKRSNTYLADQPYFLIANGATGYDPVSTVDITKKNEGTIFSPEQDLVLTFNGVTSVGQQTVGKDAEWLIETSIEFVSNTQLNNNISGDFKYVSRQKVRNSVDTFLRSNPNWEVLAVDIADLPTKPDRYTTNFGQQLSYYLKQVTVTLATQINDVDLELYDKAAIVRETRVLNNGQQYKGSIQVTIKTNLAGLLTELVQLPPNVQGLPGAPDLSKFNTQATVSAEERKQIAAPLSSALEAMLTIIKYKGITESKKGKPVTSFSLVSDTAKLLTDLSSAPLSKLFNGAALANPLPPPSPPTDPAENLYRSPYAMGLKGYCTSLMSFQVDKDNKKTTDAELRDYYNQIPNVDFNLLMQACVLDKTYEDSSYMHEGITSIEKPTYVSLGYLLFFINNVCLLFDSTKKAKTGQATPYFYIDFNPSTNFCLTMPAHMSVDPQVCILPWKGSQQDYAKLFENMNVKNLKGIFDFQSSDVISKSVARFNGESRYQGKTMEILLNVSHLLDILKQTANTDSHNDVYFRPFMDRVLADVNKATGDVNAFRVAYFDASNTAAVVDDQFVPPSDAKKEDYALRRSLIDPTGKVILPVFQKRSIARSLDFETNISTKMSSMIAIGARNPDDKKNGSTQSTDGSPVYWLSEGLKDRVITETEDITKVQNDPSATANGSQPTNSTTTKSTKDDNTLSLAENFNSYIKAIYSADKKIDKQKTESAKNYYIQALTAQKGFDPGTSGAPIIPLNLNVSLDGISGINMGNVFLLPQERLPISLRAFPTGTSLGKPRFAWMVVGLNHQISGNQWVTNIRGQIIRLRPDESYAQAGAISTAQPPITQGTATQQTLPTAPLGFTLPHGTPWRLGSTLYRNRGGKKFQIETRTGGTDNNHQGIDINGPRLGIKDNAKSLEVGGNGTSNDPIYAVYDGVVTRAGTAGGYGYAVYIKHDVNGVTYTSVYGHMPLASISVKVGDTVTTGQQIALIGTEGHSTGYHLHFELWEGEKASGKLLDPLDYLPYFKTLGGIVPDNDTIKLTPKVYG